MASVRFQQFDILAPRFAELWQRGATGSEKTDIVEVSFRSGAKYVFTGTSYKLQPNLFGFTWKAGTVHEIDVYVGGKLALSVDGLALNGNRIAGYIFDGGTAGIGLWQYILAGNDTIAGSAFDDRIFGYAGNDVITGGSGHDWLEGGVGRDLLRGGGGNDAYVIDNAAEIDRNAADSGADTVFCPFTYALGPNQEHLTITGNSAADATGNAAANILIGNARANVLVGKDGNDQLDGGAGVDVLRGGGGNDTYLVDAPGEISPHTPDPGFDTVIATFSYTLGPQQEALILTGRAHSAGTGNAGNNVLTGNSRDNVLMGLGGSDRLEGGQGSDTLVGGAGSDSLDGGAGNDVLILDATGPDRYMGGTGTQVQQQRSGVVDA